MSTFNGKHANDLLCLFPLIKYQMPPNVSDREFGDISYVLVISNLKCPRTLFQAQNDLKMLVRSLISNGST